MRMWRYPVGTNLTLAGCRRPLGAVTFSAARSSSTSVWSSVQESPLEKSPSPQIKTSPAYQNVAKNIPFLKEHIAAPARRHSHQEFQQTTSSIHPTALVSSEAVIGRNVKIGPCCVVEAGVVLHDNVTLKSHAVITGNTTIKANSIVYPFACLGEQSQDKKYLAGEPASVVIGENCTIREHVTVHSGPEVTEIGNSCLVMAGAHVAHDCKVGNGVVIANNACLAGHVTLGDGCIVGGQSGIRQHVTVGRHAMVGGMSAVDGDIIPYGLVRGNRAALLGLNLVGLRRKKIPRDRIRQLLSAYRYIFPNSAGHERTAFASALSLPSRELIVDRARQVLEDAGEDNFVRELALFVANMERRPKTSLCV